MKCLADKILIANLSAIVVLSTIIAYGIYVGVNETIRRIEIKNPSLNQKYQIYDFISEGK